MFNPAYMVLSIVTPSFVVQGTQFHNLTLKVIMTKPAAKLIPGAPVDRWGPRYGPVPSNAYVIVFSFYSSLFLNPALRLPFAVSRCATRLRREALALS